MILSGSEIAQKIYHDLELKINSLSTKPTLWAILVWEKDSPSMRYIQQKRRECKKIGMNFQLFSFPVSISEEQLKKEIISLNNNTDISWYIVQLPLPDHIDPLRIIRNMNPQKDVDGFHPENQWKVMVWDPTGFAPCTPAGVMKIFAHHEISLSGKSIVVLGQSNIVGKPMTQMCIAAWATVSSCNQLTADISLYTKNADIIISATGHVGLIRPDIVKKDAIIIDIWFSVVDGKIYWDAQYEALLAQWNTITPVPGWVWPMTVAMLLTNTLQAHLAHDKK